MPALVAGTQPRPRAGTRALVASGSLALVLVSGTAHAGKAGFHLSYSVSDELRCPDESSFRNLVAARIGYDAFAGGAGGAGADGIVQIELRPRGAGMVAKARVTRVGQSAPSARQLEDSADRCEALVAALATTVAIAIDPRRALSPPVVGTKPLDVREPAPRPPPKQASPSSGEGVHLIAAAGVVGSVGAAPTVTLGGELAVGLRTHAYSLSLAGRAETTPGSTRLDSGDQVQATLLSVGVLPCGTWSAWTGCLVGRVGAFQGYASDVALPKVEGSVFASVGARLGYSFHVTHTVAIQPTLDLGLAVARTSLVVSGATVWQASPVVGSVGLSVVLDLM